MKTDLESLFKKSLKSVAASVPVASSLAQWWSEIDSDAQLEAIEELQKEVHGIQNPILSSHPKAKEAMELLYRRIESTGKVNWEVDDDLMQILEVLSLWEKLTFLTAQHALGRRWISIRLTDPVFIMAVFSAVNGSMATKGIRRNVWNQIAAVGKGTQGDPISKDQKVPLVYIDSLFSIFESEGKGWKSKERGSTYFVPDPALCSK